MSNEVRGGDTTALQSLSDLSGKRSTFIFDTITRFCYVMSRMDPYTYLESLSNEERERRRRQYIACGMPFGACDKGLALWVAFDMETTAS